MLLAPQPNRCDNTMSCWRKDSDECYTDDDGERTVD